MIRRARPSLVRPSRSASPLALSLLAGVALPILASCAAATDTAATTSVVPTSLTVDPATFLGDVICSKQPGALQSYVATLTEITKAGKRIEFASSSPTPCSQAVQFRYVLEGHQYTIAVHGYDHLASELVPCGGKESGSPIMLLIPPAPAPPPTGACAAQLTAGAVPVSPRWQTACGDVSNSPITDDNVVARCNHPFEDVPGDGTTAIVVDPRASLGQLACTSGNGQSQPPGAIVEFDITPDANLTFHTVACDATAPTTYSKDLVPGATYTFQIGAYDIVKVPGTLPKYTAACSAVVRQGLTVPAVCGPFTAP